VGHDETTNNDILRQSELMKEGEELFAQTERVSGPPVTLPSIELSSKAYMTAYFMPDGDIRVRPEHEDGMNTYLRQQAFMVIRLRRPLADQIVEVEVSKFRHGFIEGLQALLNGENE
jgi:hypothetical protein